jgi:molecular chaperone GrpE
MTRRSDPSAGAAGAAGVDLDEGERARSGARGAAPTEGPETVEARGTDASPEPAPPEPAAVAGPEPAKAAAVAGPETAEDDAEEDVVVIPEVMPADADADAVAAERDEYLAALQRLKADFENFRKRVLRQQEEQSNRAALDLVSKLLPVLDTLDLAEAHLATAESGEDVAATAVLALGQARAQLNDVLVKEGLQRVDRADVAFDPSVHDAVAHAPAPAADGGGTMIDEVLRSGYRWRGQVLRPAMVRVRG